MKMSEPESMTECRRKIFRFVDTVEDMVWQSVVRREMRSPVASPSFACCTGFVRVKEGDVLFDEGGKEIQTELPGYESSRVGEGKTSETRKEGTRNVFNKRGTLQQSALP